MRRLPLATLLTALALAAPVSAGPLEECTPFAVPPRQDAEGARGEGGVYCGTPRSQVTVEVCVDAFAWFAGWLGMGCATTVTTGSVSLATASVTVCTDPQFPLLVTRTTAWTDRGEVVHEASTFSTAVCIH